MNFVNLVDSSKFDEFYKNWDLTFTGMIPEEAQMYVDYFKSFTDVDDTQDAYIIKGKLMNEHYQLGGTNAYPEDLNILVIPLSSFKDSNAIALARFDVGGRWFTDVVDNNARRESGLRDITF